MPVLIPAAGGAKATEVFAFSGITAVKCGHSAKPFPGQGIFLAIIPSRVVAGRWEYFRPDNEATSAARLFSLS